MQRKRQIGRTYFQRSTINRPRDVVTFGADAEEFDTEGSSGAGEDSGAEQQGMCGEMSELCGPLGVMASSMASKSLGKSNQPIPQNQIDSWKNDPSAASQQKYREAIAYNAEVMKQNAERNKLIQQFMKDALGGEVTPQDLQFGDQARYEYNALVAKYGPDVKGLTLEQAYQKYPAEAAKMITAVGNIFPAMRGKSPAEVWALLPAHFKSMTLEDLTGFFPNSSWLDPNSPASTGLSSGSSMPLILGLGVGALVIFAVSKKKG